MNHETIVALAKIDTQQGDISKLKGEVKKEGNKFKATIALVVAFVVLIVIGVATT